MKRKRGETRHKTSGPTSSPQNLLKSLNSIHDFAVFEKETSSLHEDSTTTGEHDWKRVRFGDINFGRSIFCGLEISSNFDLSNLRDFIAKDVDGYVDTNRQQCWVYPSNCEPNLHRLDNMSDYVNWRRELSTTKSWLFSNHSNAGDHISVFTYLRFRKMEWQRTIDSALDNCFCGKISSFFVLNMLNTETVDPEAPALLIWRNRDTHQLNCIVQNASSYFLDRLNIAGANFEIRIYERMARNKSHLPNFAVDKDNNECDRQVFINGKLSTQLAIYCFAEMMFQPSKDVRTSTNFTKILADGPFLNASRGSSKVTCYQSFVKTTPHDLFHESLMHHTVINKYLYPMGVLDIILTIIRLHFHGKDGDLIVPNDELVQVIGRSSRNSLDVFQELTRAHQYGSRNVNEDTLGVSAITALNNTRGIAPGNPFIILKRRLNDRQDLKSKDRPLTFERNFRAPFCKLKLSHLKNLDAVSSVESNLEGKKFDELYHEYSLQRNDEIVFNVFPDMAEEIKSTEDFIDSEHLSSLYVFDVLTSRKNIRSVVVSNTLLNNENA